MVATDQLMEAVCAAANMRAALYRVESNRGCGGVDGMVTGQLRRYLHEAWPEVREQLLKGEYHPNLVLGAEIRKQSGVGMRALGIPTVVDRLIQQALLQVLQPLWEPHFSNHSYGFRPGRSCHQAVVAAQQHIESGHAWVVDLDLAQFFDRVQHDRLMYRLGQRVRDKRVLRLIGRYLRAGLLKDGLVRARTEGTPQGGPLSPLLSNIVLDELDQELERRGHRFVRYADDCNIYVRSERAGQRVMASVSEFITKRLKLQVNAEKSAVAKPRQRKFLGFTLALRLGRAQRWIAASAKARFKTKVRGMTGRLGRRTLKEVIAELARYLRGWRGYYGFCETPSVLEELERWVRIRLRAMIVKQCRNGKQRYRLLRQQGLSPADSAFGAGGHHGPHYRAQHKSWGMAFPPSYFDRLGLPRLLVISPKRVAA